MLCVNTRWNHRHTHTHSNSIDLTLLLHRSPAPSSLLFLASENVFFTACTSVEVLTENLSRKCMGGGGGFKLIYPRLFLSVWVTDESTTLMFSCFALYGYTAFVSKKVDRTDLHLFHLKGKPRSLPFNISLFL